jgi:hypothetical protein
MYLKSWGIFKKEEEEEEEKEEKGKNQDIGSSFIINT